MNPPVAALVAPAPRPLTLEARIVAHAQSIARLERAAPRFEAARSLALLRSDWQRDGGTGGQAGFVQLYLGLTGGIIARPTVYKYLKASMALESGVQVDETKPGSWEDLCAAGKRLEDAICHGMTAPEALAKVQAEVQDGTVRPKAASAAKRIPEGMVAVQLPDTARPTEEVLHERVRALNGDAPVNAPELRALVVERLAAQGDDLLRALLFTPEREADRVTLVRVSDYERLKRAAAGHLASLGESA